MFTNRVNRWFSIAFWVMLIAIALSNLFLIRQNLQMRKELEAANARQELQPGDKLEPFRASGLHGDSFDISYTGQGPTKVFLFLAAECPYCAQQIPYWRAMLDQANTKRFEIVGLVAESENKLKVEEYLRAAGYNSTRTPLRVAVIPDSVRRSYKLNMTPTTLIVRNDGTVEKALIGKWSAGATTVAGEIMRIDCSRL